ncbi:MAG: hypothetical protein JOZ68_17025 [Acidimicrobiia bacterium]|nr:hypothetical protein [Acidimicrobiia bacterium]MBV8983475.1 hypothetical protein [Acidimicrobiia bacterium]MBV9042708.1 hypothetical protein [Acidimicrobiia bacterium]MBV9285746.1 hypothetical protein [Acidimicrobiia bacterium]
MDPELFLIGPAIAVLAVLGARRRAAQQNGLTTGQRVESAGGDVARQLGGVLGAFAQKPAEISGGVVRTTGVIGAQVVDTTLRAVGRVSGEAVRAVVAGGGQLTARSTGLVVDGGSSVVGAAASVPGRLRGHAPAPTAKKSTAAPTRARKRQR